MNFHLKARPSFNSVSQVRRLLRSRDIHGGWAFPWPATKILQDRANLTDSFREAYPDEVLHPGECDPVLGGVKSRDQSDPTPKSTTKSDYRFRGKKRIFNAVSLQRRISKSRDSVFRTRFDSKKPIVDVLSRLAPCDRLLPKAVLSSFD